MTPAQRKRRQRGQDVFRDKSAPINEGPAQLSGGLTAHEGGPARSPDAFRGGQKRNPKTWKAEYDRHYKQALPEGLKDPLPLGSPDGDQGQLDTRVALAADQAAGEPTMPEPSTNLVLSRPWDAKDSKRARLVGQPEPWAKTHGSKRRVHGISYQYLTTTEDQAFAPGEASELWEAARLELLNRGRWLRLEDSTVQRIVLELEKGPRPASMFPKWLAPLVSDGLRRLERLGKLEITLVPNTFYKGQGRPRQYMVDLYSLKPEPTKGGKR